MMPGTPPRAKRGARFRRARRFLQPRQDAIIQPDGEPVSKPARLWFRVECGLVPRGSAPTMRRVFRPASFVVLAAWLVGLTGCAQIARSPKGPSPDVGLTPSPPAQPPPAADVPPPPPPVPPETWVDLGAWAGSNHAGSWTNLTPGDNLNPPWFSLITARGLLVTQAENERVRWDGLELRLGFQPQLRDGRLWWHRLDMEKNLLPLLAEPWAPANAARRVVALDPGHGGADNGARSVASGLPEKDYALDWALRLRPLLEARGWLVKLTRTNDADVSLPARVAAAEEAAADLFLSLHFNAANSPDPAGIETYCLTPSGMPSNLARNHEDNPALTFPNNAFDAANLQVAARVHRELVAATGGPDRGVRRARFMTVLRGQNRPAVLLEGGYLSNPAEAGRIHEPEHRQRLAEAVARALD